MSMLNVDNIQKSFGKNEVLKNISFSLEKGEVLAIIGSSGSGKTTLLRCLNFLEKPQKGKITVNGEVLFDGDAYSKQKESEIRKKRLHFGMVFQSFNLFENMTVLKNCMLAVTTVLHESKKEAFERGSAKDYGKCPCAFRKGGTFREKGRLPVQSKRRSTTACCYCKSFGT